MGTKKEEVGTDVERAGGEDGCEVMLSFGGMV